MTDGPLHIRSLPLNVPDPEVTGELVSVEGAPHYRIGAFDRMDPFFVSLVSASDHWMFISSTGGLSAGRRNADHAVFPYYTVDRIHDAAPHTGSRTVLRVGRDGTRHLWEPFFAPGIGLYRTSRALYKHVHGTSLLFEETNHDLGLVFRYRWAATERFGFERRSELENVGAGPVEVEVLDGVQNLLPSGIAEGFQNRFSVLGDAYKDAQLDAPTGLATYALSSVPGDSTEPGESLRATVCWSTLDAGAPRLLSSDQLQRFREGGEVTAEHRVLGRRGAYLVRHDVAMRPGARRVWSIVLDVDHGPSQVAALRAFLSDEPARGTALRDDVAEGGRRLERIVASADGLQHTADAMASVHHFANVLFNVMRGGTFESGYRIDTDDLLDFLRAFDRRVHARHAAAIRALGARVDLPELRAAAAAAGDRDLERLVVEYLPISFSRRHGDPSRPWNHFSIELRGADGARVLAYEGNWRDIFQNWEALCLSFPEFLDGVVARFLNTTTADGYNPYRISRDGYDWERPDPEEPWANLGYWGDHQLVYLVKLLERSRDHHPGALEAGLRDDRFVYADVPYDLRPYAELLEDPRRAIAYDEGRAAAIEARVAEVGFDGRYLPGPEGTPISTTLAEKLLVPFLAKVCSFVPEAGIWLNTQRPEWNDANNALAGYGASMVTVAYARRYASFCLELFDALGENDVEFTAEVAAWLTRTRDALADHEPLLAGGAIADRDRRRVMDALGTAAGDYRAGLYEAGLSGRRSAVSPATIRDLLLRALRFFDHSIRRTRREDGLYEAYTVLRIRRNEVGVGTLYPMLEGQVAVLSSGALAPAEALEVLGALRSSAMYREDQHSYMLYPRRELPGFREKNVVPADDVERSELLRRLIATGDRHVVERDVGGEVHFNPDFRNADDLRRTLGDLRGGDLDPLIEREGELVASIFESVFDHERFTGRSGTFYGYEGLGSIYWHMVGKLLLAVQECAVAAAESDPTHLPALAERYFDVRAGLGFQKDPDVYGAFPTDPYSHTPWNGGAKQPGMTGQVKEEILTRFGELGVRVEAGRIRFDPVLLRPEEFFATPETFAYVALDGSRHETSLAPGSLAFTLCQVPVIYRRSDTREIRVTLADGRARGIEGSTLPPEESAEVFRRTGRITEIEVSLEPGLEG
jgi:hypothetical protein